MHPLPGRPWQGSGRVSRRSVVGGGALGFALAFSAAAQQPGRRHRIGVLAQQLEPGLLDDFRAGLRQFGYVEGQNIEIEVRDAANHSDRLAGLVAELLALHVEVIVAINTPAAKAAQQATATVPIVIMRVADPVKSGLVASLARPGGNVTGMYFLQGTLGAKGVELLRETLPRLSRVGALYSADNPGGLLIVEETERRCAQSGIGFVRLPVRNAGDDAVALQKAKQAGVEALFVMDDGAVTGRRQQITELAIANRLPLVSIYADFAEAGGLFAYGPSLPDVYRRGGYFVDRILNGEAPGNLPVEQPTKFLLIVNLKTAETLGLTIPPLVLARADKVIE